MNGMNGGNVAAAMSTVPTPAGHQAELNYIYGMVEELSRQLAENKRALEDVVAGVGRVRNRARNGSLSNEELITAAGDEIEGTSVGHLRNFTPLSWRTMRPPTLSANRNRPSICVFTYPKVQDRNLDSLISLLSEALDKAKYSRDANAALLSHYASVLSTMLKQFHEYKAKHVADIAAWHRSYRAQLAEARTENSRLREQIWDMQSHAGHANELLRTFRSKYDEDAVRWEGRVDAKAVRQELRFWKRMAMPELADDDSYWSDDDDLVDPAEKQRLSDMEAKAAQEQLADAVGVMGDLERGGEYEGSHQALSLVGLMGSTPMQRDELTNESAIPPGVPRPHYRPPSASSTGSSRQ